MPARWRYRGRSYTVRPLTVGDLAELQQLATTLPATMPSRNFAVFHFVAERCVPELSAEDRTNLDISSLNELLAVLNEVNHFRKANASSSKRWARDRLVRR